MFINCFLLALSVSIDSLGIGITYGIKNTYISSMCKVILFIISLIITSFSIFFGRIIRFILPDKLLLIIGTAILIVIGVYIIYKAVIQKDISYDFDNSNHIDEKESLFLGFALSLDAFCVGLGGTIMEIKFSLFPLLVAMFQLFFLTFGNFLGKKINNLVNLPSNMWSIISGSLLIGIGISRLFV